MSGEALTAKQRMLDILSEQPEDSSFDERLRELALARMVDQGLADMDAGRTVSHEQLGQEMKSWGK